MLTPVISPARLPRSAQIFLIAFAYALTMSAFIQFILLPYILPDLHAGNGLLRGYDYAGFHRAADVLAARMHEEGISAWELRPHGQAIAGILAALYWLFGSLPAVMLPLNALLFGLSAVLVHQIILGIVGNERGALFGTVLFILFPSSMLWYAQMHNDAFFVPGLLLQIWAWTMLVTGGRRQARQALAAAVTAWLFVWLVRAYFLPILAFANLMVAVAMLLFARPAGSLPRNVVIVLLFIFAPVVLWKAAPAREARFYVQPDRPASAVIRPKPDRESTPSTAPPSAEAVPRSRPPVTQRIARLLDDKRQAILRQGQRKRAGSDIHTDVRFHDLSDVVGFLPTALSAGLLAPYPDTWFEQARKPGGGAMRKLAAVEMLLAYVGIIALVWAVVTRRIRLGLLAVVMAFCLSLIIVWATAIPNVGTLYRMRMGPWMLIVSLGWAWIMSRPRRRAGHDAG